MPVALESGSNTYLLLRVQENVLQTRPVVKLNFPAETPAAFGLLQSDSAGNMAWLTQYVNALVPPPNLLYYMKGQCGADGAARLRVDSTPELKPFASKVVFALVLKARTYSASDVAAVYAQCSVTFDPSLPLDQLWSASSVERYGNDADSLQLGVTLQRTVTNGVLVGFSASSRPGNWVEVDAVVYDPTGNPTV
ncbi:hypothetical protein WJX74_003918 [Apatococcus lobatus]|uniref:Uncharacterized protein n=1 Tax=Apatococcus lobatus TaxID=904363 RepID=A0AAW1Q1S9_9CHLO